MIEEIVKTSSPLTEISETPKAETVAETEITKPIAEIKIAAKSFHLVAGCFSSELNAENLVHKLQSEGFESSVIGQNANGLFRVAFESFSSRKLALSKMQSIKASGKSTWLLKQ